MEHTIYLVLYGVLFAAFVLGGFWVIQRAAFPRFVSWGFGAVVLIVILFALVYITRSALPSS